MMDLADFKPGKLHRVKRYLGAGSWKMAFSGSAPGIPQDVALLCYHNEDARTTAMDVSRLIRLDGTHEYAGYLPEFHNLFRGDDGRWWLVEELLAQPLSNMSPLRDVSKFARIARDLCRAVTCIHSQDLVHRDIKMENCGIDQHDRAKIFDLGSLVSAPGGEPCTIFTQSPEVIERAEIDTPAFGKSADVWALAATLLALRSGDYPFASAEDVKTRGAMNDDLAKGRITRSQAQVMKTPLNEEVHRRSRMSDAESQLMARVRQYFAGNIADLLCEMLQFSPAGRNPIAEYERRWSEVAEALDRPSGSFVPKEAAWPEVSSVLTAFERGDISLTPSHVERILQDWRSVDSIGDEAREQLSRAKALAERHSAERRVSVAY